MAIKSPICTLLPFYDCLVSHSSFNYPPPCCTLLLIRQRYQGHLSPLIPSPSTNVYSPLLRHFLLLAKISHRVILSFALDP